MWPSPFNSASARAISQDRRIRIADCTLRDGEQQAGVVLTSRDKLAIATALDEFGVYEIECGTVASGDEDRAAIAAICAAGLSAKISVLCRGIAADIDLAASLGAWGVRLSFPISPVERHHKLKGISDDDYLRKALELTAHARKKGLAVIFSPYDTTRADLPFLRRLAVDMQRSGTVDRLRIVDTTGCALPGAIAKVVRDVRAAAPDIDIEIHCHDDFGLACANTLAALECGADYVSSTVNALGERCGNASTEAVVMALEVLYGYRTGLKLGMLKKLSGLVERLSNIPVPVNKAVVGENAFRHEAGMVVAGVLKEPFTAESYDPGIVGQRREILLGKKSGLASIGFKVRQLGLDVTEERFPELLEAVKSEAVRRRRALTDDEFASLAGGAVTQAAS
jgi:isopropylmalate/homocitrate/citramalate synthase